MAKIPTLRARAKENNKLNHGGSSQSIVRSLSYLTDRTLPPFSYVFGGVSAVPTYAVIPAENTCSLSAVYWPSLVIIQEIV